jgi:hypothetical protein
MPAARARAMPALPLPRAMPAARARAMPALPLPRAVPPAVLALALLRVIPPVTPTRSVTPTPTDRPSFYRF